MRACSSSPPASSIATIAGTATTVRTGSRVRWSTAAGVHRAQIQTYRYVIIHTAPSTSPRPWLHRWCGRDAGGGGQVCARPPRPKLIATDRQKCGAAPVEEVWGAHARDGPVGRDLSWVRECGAGPRDCRGPVFVRFHAEVVRRSRKARPPGSGPRPGSACGRWLVMWLMRSRAAPEGGCRGLPDGSQSAVQLELLDAGSGSVGPG